MWIFGRKGASGYSASSTAEEVTQGIDGTGLTAIVTGASSGIGVETARVLALRGVHVIMAVRNVDAGRKVRNNILEEIASAKIDVMELDLSSFASVRNFALEYKSLGIPLNILINNAGVYLPKIMHSKDNLELHFATNHLGHFLLTNLLVDTMKTTASQSQVEGRIINVSSVAQNYLSIYYSYDDIQFDKTSDHAVFEYAKSKLANVLCANELGRRLEDEGVGITVNSLHPGIIPTNIFRDRGFLADTLIAIGLWMTKCLLKNVQQGAATTCFVALHPQVNGVTGKYFSDCNIAEAGSFSTDTELAEKLWDLSLTLTHHHPK